MHLRRLCALFAVFVLLYIQQAEAQHDHTVPDKVEETGTSQVIYQPLMNRNGSGTSWLPDSAPIYGYMQYSNQWMYMLHGNLFLRYNSQDLLGSGNRGGRKVDAPNWLMGMAQRRVGERGLFRASAMISLEPLTVGGEGYPLLFQTGETWQGEPLVDRQHPHDLFAELSLAYTYRLSQDADVFAYVGYPGEPALGATAFMHRPSSLSNPDSPLGHHWQDATHITYGVATLGARYRQWKLDTSLFNGREPDEDRYGFDRLRFNSYAGRLAYNPLPEMAIQLSHAYIVSPEISHPGENVHRTTASLLHSAELSGRRFLNSALVWGYNYVDDHHKEHSLLAEGALDMREMSVYGRWEWVEKSAEELQLDETLYDHNALFPVTALTVGVNHDVMQLQNVQFRIGAQGSIYFPDNRLTDIYGKNPLAGQIYIRISPRLLMSVSSDEEKEIMHH